MLRPALVALFTLACLIAQGATAGPVAAPAVSAASIEAAAPDGANGKNPALVAKAEILLDRARFSPGEIDATDGDNYRSALKAFQEANGPSATGELDPPTWSVLASGAAPALTTYTISDKDAAGPFTTAIPGGLAEMAKLKGLSYTSPLAELAEKFHMNQEFLRRLNPRADFGRAGTQIVVANVSALEFRATKDTIEAAPPVANSTGSVAATIVVDKPAHNVRAYDQAGRLLAFYPATAGSGEKPAPSGTFAVRRVDWNPNFIYDPKFAWKGVKAKRKLTIRPGPNNPVGLAWIDLTAPSYGIHGTPEPDAIGKTQSHGCIRLTNWDAVGLAAVVRPGTVVRFADDDMPVVPGPAAVSGNKRPAAGGRRP